MLQLKSNSRYLITITNDSPQALSFVKYARTLDFVKVTKSKKALEVPDNLEEDENGIPIKYRDEKINNFKQLIVQCQKIGSELYSKGLLKPYNPIR